LSQQNDIKQYVEKVFRESKSSEELFDTFRLALQKNVDDVDSYKMLLGNPHLTNDEIVLFTEQLTKQFADFSNELYNWTGYIFQTKDCDFSLLDTSFYYYQKAFLADPTDHSALLSVLNLYNYEFDFPINQNILQLVNNGVELVKRKSLVYRGMSKHYRKIGNEHLSKRYEDLAERAARTEH
jgi:hypothetical protein